MLVDSHAHLDDDRFAGDLAETIERARQAGVDQIISVGTDAASSEEALRLAERYPGVVYATVGLHPHDAGSADDATLGRISRLARESGAVAIGETGLDYHYNHSPRQAQRAIFEWHIRLALETGLPLVLHCREAHADAIGILRSFSGLGLRGVAHCFSGSAEEAKALLDAGFLISFSGSLTFPNARNVRRAAAATPLERTLIETDSPYLAPQPHRGRRNEPAWVVHVAVALTELHRRELADVAEVTASNARRLFGISLH